MASHSKSAPAFSLVEDDEDNYYELLGVKDQPEISAPDLKRAYHRKALQWHPDKVPASEKVHAEAMFTKIKLAFGILSDPEARAAYDGVLKAQVLRRQRELEKSSKRKRMEQDLQEREHEAKRRRMEEYAAKQKLEAEKARLRKKGFQDMMAELNEPLDDVSDTPAASAAPASTPAASASSSSSSSRRERVPSVAELEQREQQLFARLHQLQRQREAVK